MTKNACNAYAVIREARGLEEKRLMHKILVLLTPPKKQKNILDIKIPLKGEIRALGSSAAMKGNWIGIARQYFVFDFRQNTVAGLTCEPVLSTK